MYLALSLDLEPQIKGLKTFNNQEPLKQLKPASVFINNHRNVVLGQCL